MGNAESVEDGSAKVGYHVLKVSPILTLAVFKYSIQRCKRVRLQMKLNWSRTLITLFLLKISAWFVRDY